MNELSENRVADDRDEPVENPMAARLYRSASGAARRAAFVVGVLAVIAFAVTLPMTPARVAWLDVPLGAFVAWAVLAVLSRVVSRAHDLESRADAWARVIQPLALLLLACVLAAAFLVSARPDLADVAATLVVSGFVSAALVVLLYPILPRMPEPGGRRAGGAPEKYKHADMHEYTDDYDYLANDPAYSFWMGNSYHSFHNDD